MGWGQGRHEVVTQGEHSAPSAPFYALIAVQGVKDGPSGLPYLGCLEGGRLVVAFGREAGLTALDIELVRLELSTAGHHFSSDFALPRIEGSLKAVLSPANNGCKTTAGRALLQWV